MFIDSAEILVEAGKGGDGAVTFRREKYVPKGGPDGGNGGKGGSVILYTDHNLATLLDFRYKKEYKGPDGGDGMAGNKDGRDGNDIIIRVPPGTLVIDNDTEELICDLDKDGYEYILARGGKGGKGNSNFATPTNQAPRYAEDGKPGEKIFIRLELKLIAHVGLVGLPNAGKSTLISTISEAKPKIADYPFTTLEPNLGIVRYKEYHSFTVADIPGIIEGAHQGKGLGLQFLRHIERTSILLFMIDALSEDHVETYNVLYNELKKYSKILVGKKKFVAITKADVIDEETQTELKKLKFKGVAGKPFIISSATRFGLQGLLDALWKEVDKNK